MATAPEAMTENGETRIPKDQLVEGQVYMFMGVPRRIQNGKAIRVEGDYAAPKPIETPKAQFGNSRAIDRYSQVMSQIVDINNKLSSRDFVENANSLKKEREGLLKELEYISPGARWEAGNIATAAQGEQTIEKAGDIAEAVTYAGTSMALAPTALTSPVAAFGTGVVSEGAGEMVGKLTEGVTPAITGVKPGDTMRELAMQKGYPDIEQFRVIIKTPEALQQKGEDGLTGSQAIKQLPPEYKGFLLENFAPGSPERVQAWSSLYGKEPANYDELAMATGVQDTEQERVMQEMAISGGIEVAALGAGKAIGALRAGPSVKRAFGEQILSPEAIAEMESKGIKVPYAQTRTPKNTGLNYLYRANNPDSALSKLYRENTGKVAEAATDVQKELLNIVESKVKSGKVAAGINLSRKLQSQIGEEVADTAALKLRMIADGMPAGATDDILLALEEAGIKRSDALKMTAQQLKQAAGKTELKPYIDEISKTVMPKAERVKQLQELLIEARQVNSDYVGGLYDALKAQTKGVTVNMTGVAEQVDQVIKNRFGYSPAGTAAKGTAVKAVEKEAERDVIDSAIQPLLAKTDISFDELHQLRKDIDNIFPKNNNTQNGALTEIRDIISRKMVETAENAGFKEEFSIANDSYRQFARQRDSKILAKIIGDKGLEESFAKSLLEGEGNLSVLNEMMDMMPQARKESFKEVIRNTALNKMLGSGDPVKNFNRMGRDVQSILKNDFSKVQGVIDKYKQQIQIAGKAELAEAGSIDKVIQQFRDEISANTVIGAKAKDKILSLTSKYVNTDVVTALDPQSMKIAITKELDRYDAGMSSLNNVMSRKELETLNSFADGASAAMGKKISVQGGTDPLKQAQKGETYAVFSFKPGMIATTMGYIAAMTGRQRTIARKLIDPEYKTAVQEISGAIARAGSPAGKVVAGVAESTKQAMINQTQNARRLMLKMYVDAYQEDEGQKMPADEIIKINSVIKDILRSE